MKWVEILLLFITIIAVFFLAAECDDFKLFVISKLICLSIICCSSLIHFANYISPAFMTFII